MTEAHHWTDLGILHICMLSGQGRPRVYLSIGMAERAVTWILRDEFSKAHEIVMDGRTEGMAGA